MEVTFWGVRGSIASPGPATVRYGGNTSCVSLRLGTGDIVILDCGTGARNLGLALLNGPFGRGQGHATIFLSHTHWDHIQGLPFFAPAYCERNRIKIWTPPARREQIERALTNQMDRIHFPVPLTALSAITRIDELPAKGKNIGHVRVRSTNLNHPGGCGGWTFNSERQVPTTFLSAS